MSLINQFLYYKNHTNKYKILISHYTETMISKNNKKSILYLYPQDLDELTNSVLNELKRITNELEAETPLTEEDIAERNNDISIIKREIQNDILDEFKNKGFKPSYIEDGIKLKYK